MPNLLFLKFQINTVLLTTFSCPRYIISHQPSWIHYKQTTLQSSVIVKRNTSPGSRQSELENNCMITVLSSAIISKVYTDNKESIGIDLRAFNEPALVPLEKLV